jgi:hypothetical protein
VKLKSGHAQKEARPRAKTAMIHLHVADVDADYKHPIEAGAASFRRMRVKGAHDRRGLLPN